MRTRPNKRLGQNFLCNRRVVEKIIKVAEIKGEDTILEIGPGQGALTRALVKKMIKVIAVEKDAELYQYLLKKFVDSKNIQLIHGDILGLLGNPNYPEFIPNYPNGKNIKYKVVANIPYYLTSFLLRKIFELKNKPELAVLMVQKEVAERITARPPHMNLLAIGVQIFSEPKIMFYVNRNSFWPSPRVDSAVVRFRTRLPARQVKNCELGIKNQDKFFNLVRIGFSSKRKMLVNNLSAKLKIPKEKIYNTFEEIGLNNKARAQELSLEDWEKIYGKIYSKN